MEAKTASQTTWTDISGNLPSIEEWQEGIVSLNNYSGMDSVFIRFKWSDDNKWASGFAVDNIVVDKLDDNDLSVVAYDHYITGNRYVSNYSIIPKSQISVPTSVFLEVL